MASAAISAAQTTTTTATKPKPVAAPAKPLPLAVKPLAPRPAVAAPKPVAVQPAVVAHPATLQPAAAVRSVAVQPTAVQPASVQPVAARTATTAGAATYQAAPQYQQAVQQYQQQAAPAQQYASQGTSTASGGQVLGANTMQGVLAGIGSFKFSDVTALAMACMRSGTRVFCDYDETKQGPGDVPAGWGLGAVQLVLADGRIAGVSDSFYVGSDGSTFKNASLNATSPVRLMLEYDNVPTQSTNVTLQYNNTQFPNVPLSDIGVLADTSHMPARSQSAGAPTATTQQPGTDPNAAQTLGGVGGALDKTTAVVTNTQQKAADTQQKMKALGTSLSGLFKH